MVSRTAQRLLNPGPRGAALVDADAQPACDARAAPPDDLAQRLSADDPGSLEALVARHQQRVTRLAFRLLGWRAAEVEDVVQDVFLAAWTNRGRYRGDATVATWLTVITINRCRSEHRRRRLRSLFLLRGRGQDGVAEPPPWSRAAGDETSARVRAAVQALPPRDREVIVLRYFEQMTAAQIAAVTRQSVNAVEVRLHRARSRLADALERWHREEHQ